jgi:hypothetical protein
MNSSTKKSPSCCAWLRSDTAWSVASFFGSASASSSCAAQRSVFCVRTATCIGPIRSPRRAEGNSSGCEQAGPTGCEVLSDHCETTVITTQLHQWGITLSSSLTLETTAPRALTSLSRRSHLDRAHLGVARDQMRVEVQPDIVACCRDSPQLAFKAAVSISVGAIRISRCRVRWRQRPQWPA